MRNRNFSYHITGLVRSGYGIWEIKLKYSHIRYEVVMKLKR